MNTIRFFKSLTFRITIWYAIVSGFCFVSVFGVFYLMMEKTVQRWADEELKEQLCEVRDDYDGSNLKDIMVSLQQEEKEENGSFMARIGRIDGKLLFASVPDDLQAVPFHPPVPVPASVVKAISAETACLSRDRSVRVMYATLSPGLVLQMGLVVTRHDAWMKEFMGILIRVAFFGLLLGLLGSMAVAYRGLASLRKMTRTITEISGDNLNCLVPLSGRGDEVERLSAAFNEMLQRIHRLVRGMKEVTDAVAHDLRTPLAGIRGTAEIALRAPRSPEDYRLVLYRIVDQIDTLLGLFHSMLDVSEAENGLLVIDREPVAPYTLMEDLVDTFEPVAAAKGVRIQLESAATGPVTGDRKRLFQTLSNLLDNAIKYTPRGGAIRLAVRADPDRGEVVLSVEDSGCGIDPADLPHIFERYYRGGTKPSYPGSGLGLALVRAIVKAHGGRVIVKSVRGKGSRFTIFLPGAPGSHEPQR